MKELYPLTGIVTVLNTPFTEDDRIDFAGLKKNVQSALNAGVSGFLVPAMASEVYKLTREERAGVVQSVMETVSGEVPVIGGAGETDREERSRIIRDLIKIGCKNVLLQIPFKSEVQFLEEVAEAAEMDIEMIMIQDWDSSGKGLPLSLICKIFEEIEKFRCLKIEVVPAGPKYSAVLRATGGKLNVSGGWAVSQMTEGLLRGVHAFMPTGMHQIYCKIYSLYQSGNVVEAENLFQKVLPVLAFSNQHLDISIHFFKRLLWRQGIYCTAKVREPILPFDQIHIELADKLIDQIIKLSEKL